MSIACFVGRQFGRLTVLEEWSEGGGRKCRVQCTCGVVKTLAKSDLTKTTTSCGCRRAERATNLNRTTGMTSVGTGAHGPTARSWKSMMARCYSPTVNGYSRYGGAGIRVHERWHSYASFLSDMGKRPAGTSLDRIDGARGYEPGNCRWATRIEQANNTRHNKLVTAFGRVMTLAQWARELGIDRGLISDRLRRGWPAERALTEGISR